MLIDIQENNLKSGVLTLVLALVEIIRDALRIQALKRMEGGLGPEESERLGRALMELDRAIEQVKAEQGLSESVESFREGLDGLVDDVINKLLSPEGDRGENERDRLAGPANS
ncbi:MAG: gas vesicle protein K [Chloroflexi bacterium]|nr:gas vesicle protein K [Chloroflexota bacterium]